MLQTQRPLFIINIKNQEDRIMKTEDQIKLVFVIILIALLATCMSSYHQRGKTIEKLQDKIISDSLSHIPQKDTLN